MVTVDKTKIIEVVTVDPNFSLPADVIDVGYKDIDDAGASTSDQRSGETGDAIEIIYDEPSTGDSTGDGSGITLFPPTTVTVVDQQTRITADGRTVVDVILDVPDIPDGVSYDIRITKT